MSLAGYETTDLTDFYEPSLPRSLNLFYNVIPTLSRTFEKQRHFEKKHETCVVLLTLCP